MSSVKPFSSVVTMLESYSWGKNLADVSIPLYHYTDAAGVMGILEKQNLRLSDSFHLNDHREQLEARDATLHVMQNILARSPEKPHRLLRFADNFMKQIDLNGPRTALMFIGCFSTDRDSLTQWRSYGRGEGGFAIGFKALGLWNMAKAEMLGEGVHLLPCNYDLDAYKAATECAFELGEQEFIELSQTMGELSAFGEFVRRIGWYSNALKHHAFSSEREWRLMYQPLPQVKEPLPLRHLANNTFRPYVEFKLGTPQETLGLIKEIVVGPQRHVELAAQGLKSFVQTTLGGAVPIEQSLVPFRAMQ